MSTFVMTTRLSTQALRTPSAPEGFEKRAASGCGNELGRQRPGRNLRTFHPQPGTNSMLVKLRTNPCINPRQGTQAEVPSTAAGRIGEARRLLGSRKSFGARRLLPAASRAEKKKARALRIGPKSTPKEEGGGDE